MICACRMHGRVTRIFVTPLIRALKTSLGPNPFLDYLDSFRYILAGEFSMLTDLARRLRIPGDWGLEVGVLAEVHRNCALSSICQADLADNYEHKHQSLTLQDPNKGLLKMGTDIAKSIFRTLASMGYVLTNEFFVSLKSSYLRTAQDLIARYEYDSLINGLTFDRHAEGSAAEAFVRCIVSAGQQFLETPIETPYISTWKRVAAAIPNVFELLLWQQYCSFMWVVRWVCCTRRLLKWSTTTKPLIHVKSSIIIRPEGLDIFKERIRCELVLSQPG